MYCCFAEYIGDAVLGLLFQHVFHGFGAALRSMEFLWLLSPLHRGAEVLL
jgi:hypothetical protein